MKGMNRDPGGDQAVAVVASAALPLAAGRPAELVEQLRRCSCLRAFRRRRRPGPPGARLRRRVKPSKGTNCVARRLPTVIVPVLSKSRVSTSPATSTAFPLLAMMLARSARSMPGDADGRQQGADRRGNQADQQGHQRGHVGAEADQPARSGRDNPSCTTRRCRPSARAWRSR